MTPHYGAENEPPHYTVSGDAEHVYVSDPDGRIIATCPTVEDASLVAAALNADLYDLVTLLQTAGWERRGAVGGEATAPCPNCRHGGHEVYSKWIVCSTCNGAQVVAVDQCPTCGHRSNHRPLDAARTLAVGDRIAANPCVVTIVEVGEVAVGECSTCHDRHVIDRHRYEAGKGPWAPAAAASDPRDGLPLKKDWWA